MQVGAVTTQHDRSRSRKLWCCCTLMWHAGPDGSILNSYSAADPLVAVARVGGALSEVKCTKVKSRAQAK